MMNYDYFFEFVSQESIQKQHIIQIGLHVSTHISEYEGFYISDIRTSNLTTRNPEQHIDVLLPPVLIPRNASGSRRKSTQQTV